MSDMTNSEKAVKVIEALKAAEREPPLAALPMLNELAAAGAGRGRAAAGSRGGAIERLHGDLRSGQGVASAASQRKRCGRRRSRRRSGGSRWREGAEPAIPCETSA